MTYKVLQKDKEKKLKDAKLLDKDFSDIMADAIKNVLSNYTNEFNGYFHNFQQDYSDIRSMEIFFHNYCFTFINEIMNNKVKEYLECKANIYYPNHEPYYIDKPYNRNIKKAKTPIKTMINIK